MRILLIITCLANIAFALGSLSWLPNPMAVHFSHDGTPDGFASPLGNAVLMSLLVGGMGIVFFGLSWFMPILPNSCFNLPNRDYWFNEENRPKTIRRFSAFLESIGAATMFFFLVLQWEVFQANQTVPPKRLNLDMMFGGSIVLIAFILFESVRLYLAFRLAKRPSS